MKIRDIMKPGAFTINETDTLGTAQRAMTRARIRHLPVTSDGKLVGMLSERDILSTRAASEADDEWWKIPIRIAMRAPAQTVGPDDSLTEVAGRLAAAKIGALPVVERGKLIGLVTTTDVLDAEVRSAMAPAPLSSATAADAMTPFPYCIGPTTLLVEAVELMLERHVRHLPVVDAGTIVGMLSEQDVRTAIGEPTQYIEMRTRSPAQYRVFDVMTRHPAAVAFDTPLVEIARRFANERIGALPVVDKFGALIGIISYVDALRVLSAR
jgi:acetoin utilization protein AcuB